MLFGNRESFSFGVSGRLFSVSGLVMAAFRVSTWTAPFELAVISTQNKMRNLFRPHLDSGYQTASALANSELSRLEVPRVSSA